MAYWVLSHQRTRHLENFDLNISYTESFLGARYLEKNSLFLVSVFLIRDPEPLLATEEVRLMAMRSEGRDRYRHMEALVRGTSLVSASLTP